MLGRYCFRMILLNAYRFLKTLQLSCHRISIFSIFPIFLLFLSSCGRTPSELRFEKATDINIPSNVEVIRDEYQDMDQDYAIYYSIKLDQKQFDQIRQSIQDSKYFVDDLTKIIDSDSEETVWVKTNFGYEFSNSAYARTSFSSSLDSSSLEMHFSELAD